MQVSNKHGLLALSPLLVFIFIYLVSSMVLGDFYKMPITVAFMFSGIYAIALFNRKPLSKRIEIFSRGASTKDMMLMLWIFVLAGAFAMSAKAMGSIDATVNLTLNILPGNLLLPGIFFAACIISISIGTSVGTIVALTPIAIGIAEQTGVDLAFMTALVVGGSFFGDNLSFISDTTVAATGTQDCSLRDKFLVNIYIVAPAVAIIFIVYFFLGLEISAPELIGDIKYLSILPYAVVIITAIRGMNVMAVLTIGLVMTGIIGIITEAYDFYGWMGAMGEGIAGMGELIIITMLAGGLLEVIRENGGIDYIVNKTTQYVNGRRGGEAVIAFLVAFVDVCTANNTVAIITVGGIAKNITHKFGIDPRKTASILDTASCCIQGLIPYGAQVLIAAGLSSINPIDIIPYLYYPFAIGIMTIFSIIFRYPKKYS